MVRFVITTTDIVMEIYMDLTSTENVYDKHRMQKLQVRRMARRLRAWNKMSAPRESAIRQ